MKNRVIKIFKNIKKEPDAIIILNSIYPRIDENFFYFTGLEKGLFENSAIVLFPDGNIELFVTGLECLSAKKSKLKINLFKNYKEFNKFLRELLSSYKTIGLNYKAISYYDLNKLRETFPKKDFIDISENLLNARLIKDDQEIKLLKKSCKISDDIMKKIPDIVADDITENKLSAEIDYNLIKNGADKPAFDTISSFGKNSAQPHYTHGNVKLKNKDFILCDFGASYKNYKSDITRTFVFGKPTKKQKEMSDTVLKAQELAFNSIKVGIKANEIHKKVFSYINKTKFKGRFIHSTGHSLGLNVHDGIGFSQDNNTLLKENMIFTVEPGIYLPNLGGVRIEDDVLIRNEGVEILTKSPRHLIEI